MMLLLGIGIIALLAVAYLFKKMLVFDEIPNIIVPTTKCAFSMILRTVDALRLVIILGEGRVV